MEIAKKRKRIDFDGSSQHQQPLNFVDTDEDDDCELLLKEETKKKIYLQMKSWRTYVGLKWFIADISSNILEEANVMMNSMPCILQNTLGYATALLKSKLFFLGGRIWDKLDLTYKPISVKNVRNTVFAFDVVTQTWDDPSEYPNLLSPRSLGRAEAVDDKIFLFGSRNNYVLLQDEQHYAEYLDLSIIKEKRQWRYIPNAPRQLWQRSRIQSIAVYNSKSNKASVGGEKHHFLFWVYPEGCLFILDYHSLKWQTVEQILDYLPKEPSFTNVEVDVQICEWMPAPGSYICEKIYPNLAPCWSETVVVQDDALFWHFGSKLYAIDFTNSNPEVGVIELCNFNYPSFLECAKYSLWSDCFPTTFLVSQGNGKLCLIWVGCGDEPTKFHCQNFQVQRKNDGTLVARPGSLSNFDSHPDFKQLLNLFVV